MKKMPANNMLQKGNINFLHSMKNQVSRQSIALDSVLINKIAVSGKC